MRGTAAFALVIAACATAPANTAPEGKTAAREVEDPEPAPLPDLPPRELADRIVEAQQKSHENVTDAVAVVEINLQSTDDSRVRNALAVLEALAVAMARVEQDDARHDWNWYRAYNFDFLSDHVNGVLDDRYESAPCALIPEFAHVVAQFRPLPGFHAPKAHFRGPRENRLSRRAIACGMQAVDHKVAACYATYHVPGDAIVDVMINRAGAVTWVATLGKFAGTPTGDCVAAAAKTATFPPSDGATGPHLFSLK